MEFNEFLNPKDILQNILEVLHCPFCGSDYLEKNTKIKAQFEKDYVVHLMCQECHNSIVASFSYQGGHRLWSPKSLNKKTDAPINEMMHFIPKGTINDDDIMNFHKGIKDFDGDFKKIFGVKNKKIIN